MSDNRKKSRNTASVTRKIKALIKEEIYANILKSSRLGRTENYSQLTCQICSDIIGRKNVNLAQKAE